jgi:Ca2+:H+ antiporter
MSLSIRSTLTSWTTLVPVPVPLHLGLSPMHIVLLALTCIVTVLTVVPRRATLLQAGVHLALLGAYLFLSFSP